MSFEDDEQICYKLIEKYGFARDIIILDISEFPNERWSIQLLKDTLLLDFKVAYSYIMCYTEEKVVFFKEGKRMTSKFTIEIPYDSRSKYISAVKDINRLIDKNGVFMIFINNMPYNPSSFLVIETNTNADEINKIIKDNSLTIVSNRGIEEFTYELAERKWDGTPLSNDFSIDLAFKYGFHFAEKIDLEQKGYGFGEPISRRQIFISYCHKDKAKVLEIVDAMRRSGLYVWVDIVEIDLGDSIIERVDSGIRNAEMSIIFMSKHTQTAMFARHELKTLFSQYINSQKPWVIVKLDEMEPEEVFVGLKDTKYFDYSETPNMQLLIDGIKKKMSKIK